MKVGAFGKGIVFKVSKKETCTFDDFTQSVSGRWSDSERVGRKPITEFNGPDLTKVNFTMVIDSSLGVKPEKMLEKLRTIVTEGKTDYLVIGNRRVGQNMFTIKSIQEEWNTVLPGGVLASAKVKVEMEEYVTHKIQNRKRETTTRKLKGKGDSKRKMKYIVKKGDTLWDLAKKYLGKGKRYTEIYKGNKDVIEKEAKKRRRASSENGHWIYPGTVLEIEVET